MRAIRRLGWPTIALAVAIDLALLWKSSALVKTNADAVQNVLEVAAILRGNVLLHGWVLTSDDFYLSDNPFFLLTRLIFGRSLAAIYAAPFLIYVAVLAAASAIVWRSLPDRSSRLIGFGCLAFYLATPDPHGLAPVALVGAQHIAILAFCLLAWAALDGALGTTMRSRRACLLSLYGVAVFVIVFSDPLGIVVFLPATLAVLGLACRDRRGRVLPLGVIGATLLIGLAARMSLQAMPLWGGFSTSANFSPDVVGAGALGRNAAGVVFGLLHLSGASWFGRPAGPIAIAGCLIRLAGLVVMLVTVASVAWRALRMRERWTLRLVLALAVAVDLASALASAAFSHDLVPQLVTGGASVRYLTPAILFGGVLVALELPRMVRGLAAPARRVVLGIGGFALIAAIAAFAGEVAPHWTEAPFIARSPARRVADYLRAHQLDRGVAPYWDAALITALSGERVVVRAVIAPGPRLVPYVWIADRRWYRARPQFVIYRPGNAFNVTIRTITATYGPPAARTQFGRYTIAVLRPHP